MAEEPLATFFGPVGVMYGFIIPIALVALLAIFFIASALSPNARPSHVAQSTYCYMMMGFGILLMTIAAIPTVLSVLEGTSYSTAIYIAYLILFAAGGSVFLWHDNWVRSLDASSRMVPSLIYLYTIKIIGTLTTIVTGLSIVLTVLLGSTEQGWWALPLTFFLYGFVLYLSTRIENAPVPPLFSNCSVKPRKAAASKVSKPKSTKKKRKTKRKKK